MSSYIVHGKHLSIPSFFQVYNYGGGNGDKDREIVYADLSKDTPKLINYYYICNEYPHLFQSKYFDDALNYDNIGDLFNDIRQKLIKDKCEVYKGYHIGNYDFKNDIFLLDSGAFNIIKKVAQTVGYDVAAFKQEIVSHMIRYYDFANSLKVDIVVGFDLGGKYTKKDQETNNKELSKFLANIDVEELNNYLLEETIKYLSKKADYFPLVLATVHGRNEEEFEINTKYILNLEHLYKYSFWGFALGGIASTKGLEQSWYDTINFSYIKKSRVKSAIAPGKASRVVRNLVGKRPIHALGCGGYPNIVINYYCGATSFDAASPVRRVGDGNEESTHYIYSNYIPKSAKFSKYLIGGIKMNGKMLPGNCEYVELNKVDDNYPLCGCYACQTISSVRNIKELYAMKSNDNEANYYSRQIMGLHAVNQHTKLCQIICDINNIDEFCDKYNNALNSDIKKLYHQL
ncbi:MAG: hypothetical protein NC213_05885 [Acetobacter sp.]|nr:hypothetical protein [Bacteroides sp.]MCM1341258.1 hypothetical protein [Acetobacter sp.]MCM1433965.1 hypothetical protein [Clostridiales bacterium]